MVTARRCVLSSRQACSRSRRRHRVGRLGWERSPHNTRDPVVPTLVLQLAGRRECIDAGVSYLDKARKPVGLPPYALPADFPSLSPTREVFILVNLDRIQYGLPPFPGMTAALNHDALVTGVWRADDPHPSNTAGLNTWWPGWAGAFYNAPMAYEAWVWNDGLGSTKPPLHADRSLALLGAPALRAVEIPRGPGARDGRGRGTGFEPPPRLRVSLRRRQAGLQAPLHIHLEAGRRATGRGRTRTTPLAVSTGFVRRR